MTKVLIVIVKRSKTILLPEVLGPISKYPVLVVDRPTDFPDDLNMASNVTRSIAQAIVRYNRLEAHYDYIFMLDSDCVIPEDAIEKMLKEIKPGETLCIPTKGRSGVNHIICSACLLSLTDYLKVNFNVASCHCYSMPNPRYVDGIDGYEIRYNKS